MTSRSTSIEAWNAVRPHAKNLREKLYNLLVEEGPATCYELEVRGQLHRSTASARVTDLNRAGRIRDTGERRKLPTTGRNAIVWEAIQ